MILRSVCDLRYSSFGLKKLFNFLKKNVSKIFLNIFFQSEHSCSHESNIRMLLLDWQGLIGLTNFLHQNKRYLAIGLDKLFDHFHILNAGIVVICLNKLIDVYVCLDRTKLYWNFGYLSAFISCENTFLTTANMNGWLCKAIWSFDVNILFAWSPSEPPSCFDAFLSFAWILIPNFDFVYILKLHNLIVNWFNTINKI